MFTRRELKLLLDVVGTEVDERSDGFDQWHTDEDNGSLKEWYAICDKIHDQLSGTTWETYVQDFGPGDS